MLNFISIAYIHKDRNSIKMNRQLLIFNQSLKEVSYEEIIQVSLNDNVLNILFN